MRKLVLLFTGSFAIFTAMMFAHNPIVIAQFDPLGAACQGEAAQSVACNENIQGQSSENPITSTTENIVEILSLVIAAVAVVIIIIAGITMTLSQGDSGKIKSSRDAIIYAAVGLVVAALARAIVFFIVNRTR